MDLPSALNSPRMALHSAPLPTNPRPSSNLYLPLRLLLPRFSSTLTSARRRNHRATTTTSSSPKNKNNKQSLAKNRVGKDEDPIEALFTQLEEDLKNDDVSIDDDEDDEDISEEDLALLEQELAEAFGADADFNLDSDHENEEDDADEDEDEDDDEDEDEEEEEPPVKLKNWQLRRLASALKAGRRKTSVRLLFY